MKNVIFSDKDEACLLMCKQLGNLDLQKWSFLAIHHLIDRAILKKKEYLFCPSNQC